MVIAITTTIPRAAQLDATQTLSSTVVGTKAQTPWGQAIRELPMGWKILAWASWGLHPTPTEQRCHTTRTKEKDLMTLL